MGARSLGSTHRKDHWWTFPRLRRYRSSSMTSRFVFFLCIFFGAKIMHGCVMWLHSAKHLKGSEVNFVTITPLISFINFNALHCGMWSWNVFVCLSQGYVYCQKLKTAQKWTFPMELLFQVDTLVQNFLQYDRKVYKQNAGDFKIVLAVIACVSRIVDKLDKTAVFSSGPYQ